MCTHALPPDPHRRRRVQADGFGLVCSVIAVAILTWLTMWVLKQFRDAWELRIREWLFDPNQVRANAGVALSPCFRE